MSTLSLGFVFSLLIMILYGCMPQSDNNTKTEADDVSLYIIAVKREKREEIASNWSEQVNLIPGIEVQSTSSSNRMMVLATETGIGLLKKKMGLSLYIEPAIDHTKNK